MFAVFKTSLLISHSITMLTCMFLLCALQKHILIKVHVISKFMNRNEFQSLSSEDSINSARISKFLEPPAKDKKPWWDVDDDDDDKPGMVDRI